MQYTFRLLPVLMLLVFSHCGSNEETQVTTETSAAAMRQTNVTVQTLRPESLNQYSRLPATVKAWHDATLSALESGVVSTVSKDFGDTVQRGDTLAQLDLEVLEQMAIESQANLKYQTYNFKHSKKLIQEGSISEQAHHSAEYDFQRARSNARTIATRLSFGNIRAPFSGQIAQRFIDKGQLVAQGSPTFRLVQVDSLRIEAWVSEEEIVDLEVGRSITLTLDAFHGESFQGTIKKMGTTADDKRRVYPIEAHLANPDERILPGMIGKLKIMRQTYRQVVVVPREAILERETGPVAFVAIDNKAHLRPLTLGPAENASVVVKHGLEFGDQLILKGNRDLIDGDPIQIKKMESAP